MIAKRSDLILENFVIVESQLSLIIPTEQLGVMPVEIFNLYPVDIDFNLERDNNVELYRLVTTVQINNCEEKKPGYSIMTTGMGFFKFSPECGLTLDQKMQLLQVSGLSICITNLRAYIANQTSYFPWGSYSFHAVDINALLEGKQNR